MPGSGDVLLFALAALVLAVTPGPSVLYIVARSVSQGRAAGIVSCLGIALGGSVHVVAAALGLSALLATSALALDVVRYAGAAYLIGLGIGKLMRPPDQGQNRPVAALPLARVFYEGALVNALNPKTALFFVSFLPQFVVPSRADVAVQVTLLGGLFLVIAFISDASWSLLASGAGTWLEGHPRYVASERYVVGGVYLGLGLATALSSNGRK